MSNDSLFYKLYLASRRGIYRAVSRIVPPHEIEDILQETYVRICQIENKEQISSPKSFIFTIARNLALDYKKQANVKQVDHVDDPELLDQLLSEDCRDEVYDLVLSGTEFGHFCEAVRQLPLQCRKVFVLKKVYGYSQKEIAAKLRISESTVEKHIATGMKSCTLFMRKATRDDSGQGQSNANRHYRGGSYE
ncbi:RNA polymerase sigma factor [Rheinheimera sediminis]|uniref:RNA polymerase sigma factor n=1 Tax=Rheinheimera sp. YQF-1 TaxID=2499626 RepID=UPI000FD7F396|nr:RNA polymerase sigma factor [Rheinheimera sp. YQF-1]RVT41632.1 RNA polymerase sigma factor [Rheinheimera sp. YQF-1]